MLAAHRRTASEFDFGSLASTLPRARLFPFGGGLRSMTRFRLNSDGLGALSRWRSETTRVVPSLLESWASWLLVLSAASTLDPLALDVAISCVKETRGRMRHQPRRRAQSGWSAVFPPIIPELFSIPGRTYYSQNYSGIISASLVIG